MAKICDSRLFFFTKIRKVSTLHDVKLLIGASLSEPHMGSKSVPRELSIYLSMYLCMRTSFRKCPRALIHWTVQYFTAVNF